MGAKKNAAALLDATIPAHPMEMETAGVTLVGISATIPVWNVAVVAASVTTGHSRALKRQLRASMSAAGGLVKEDLKSHSV